MNRPAGSAPVIGIAGWKKSGKTTLVTGLIGELTRRGLRVATVKHAHHRFQVDDAETDSARHRRAGAGQVAIVSRERWAMVRELQGQPEPDLAEVIAWLDPCDLVIVEGYKHSAIPRSRCAAAPPPAWSRWQVRAPTSSPSPPTMPSRTPTACRSSRSAMSEESPISS